MFTLLVICFFYGIIFALEYTDYFGKDLFGGNHDLIYTITAIIAAIVSFIEIMNHPRL